jgi:hypothetical protein
MSLLQLARLLFMQVRGGVLGLFDLSHADITGCTITNTSGSTSTDWVST